MTLPSNYHGWGKHLLWFLVIFQACTRVEPQEIIGLWSIDQLVEDGMDKTRQLHSLPWGTAIVFSQNGRFLTNGRQNNTGTWKISENGGSIYLYFHQKGVQYEKWEITATKKYLALKATTKQLYLSRSEDFPTLPPVVINLKSHLPGTWYFYQIEFDSTLMSYAQHRSALRWMKIYAHGSYRSGVGATTNFRGNWALHQDTLTFSNINDQPQSWKISMDKKGILYFYPLAGDTARWEAVSFINAADLPQ